MIQPINAISDQTSKNDNVKIDRLGTYFNFLTLLLHQILQKLDLCEKWLLPPSVFMTNGLDNVFRTTWIGYDLNKYVHRQNKFDVFCACILVKKKCECPSPALIA